MQFDAIIIERIIYIVFKVVKGKETWLIDICCQFTRFYMIAIFPTLILIKGWKCKFKFIGDFISNSCEDQDISKL